MTIWTHRYDDTSLFLAETRAALETQEAANGLMLGIAERLVRDPHTYGDQQPLLRTYGSAAQGLLLAALMTPPRKLIVYGHAADLGEAPLVLARDLGDSGWSVPGVLGPSAAARAVAEAWAAISGHRVELAGSQRVYELRRVLTRTPERGHLRRAAESEAGLVARWYAGFNRDVFGATNEAEAERSAQASIQEGTLYFWDDGGPVSLARPSRPTAHGISIGPVYTPPEHRNHGYATACVGELSRLLLAGGYQFCALHADAANPVSNHVYQKIGFRSVCDYDEYTFAA